MNTTSRPRPPLPVAGWRELLLWILRRRTRLRVTGDSMRPTLAPGDVVLVDPRAFRHGRIPAWDDIVVARHPQQPDLEIIKRVAIVEADGQCLLLSDNPAAGTDSRQFGTVPVSALRGRVMSKIED